METSNITIIRGTAPILHFPLVYPENVTGWTTVWRLRTGNTVNFSYAGTISALPNATTLGIFDVSVFANQTSQWVASDYHWTFERLNPGFEDVLGRGTLKVENP